ncbi:hypothetical protein ACFWRG_07430 [Micromonospora tulbaghiae]|uniref:Secreted protein n=1 Tax=Micromonospora tulbaghiae TaxID=479978 RepID=A0AAW4JJK1_9ACTN|nr:MULTISPECIES: hypothetical protein [Micromonospora]KAB1908529.1 hypothetical protein F8279_06840 [Micromonospora sp. AMSO1212t]MBO4141485.1 hypothetical protein [Micromonospora tulbaghiae]MDX5460702.1 hypothetical protein [Micromonospora tulbaghiae]SCF14175.1 hypothetical protein GA0070562_0542 [Micromonospora tulbaghiae]
MRSTLSRLIVALASMTAAILVFPASAQAAPGWQSYTYTSKWHCSQASSDTSIAAVSVCVVVNGQATQAVVTVTNKRSSTIQIQAPTLTLYSVGQPLSTVSCNFSYLTANQTTACFGPTFQRTCSQNAQTWAKVNYSLPDAATWKVASGWSPTWNMCTVARSR